MQHESNLQVHDLQDIVKRLDYLEWMLLQIWNTVHPHPPVPEAFDHIEFVETKLGPNGETMIPQDFAEDWDY